MKVLTKHLKYVSVNKWPSGGNTIEEIYFCVIQTQASVSVKTENERKRNLDEEHNIKLLDGFNLTWE